MSRSYPFLIAAVLTAVTFNLAAGDPIGQALANPASPAVPTHLAQQVNGTSINANSWATQNTIVFSMRATGSGGWLHPEIELRPQGTPFTNHATLRGPGVDVASGSTATLSAQVSNLKNGKYSWQARIVDQKGHGSAWASFAATGFSIGIDTVAPSVPNITSPTNPKWGHWYRTKLETFSWSSKDNASGMAGYSYSFSHTDKAPRPQIGQETTATFKNTPDGKWVLHVWARDVAGNWSQPSDYKFNILNTAPKVTFVSDTDKHFNPFDGSETWTYSLNRWAPNVRLEIDRSGLNTPVLTKKLGKLSSGKHEFTWDGNDAQGKMVPHGWYWLRVFTSDSLGNQGKFTFGGIQVWPKNDLPYYPESGHHIVVSLSKEALYAYDGHKLVYQSLVTTGNPALPTPTGHFTIFAKFSPFEFVSPWPPSSPYYYAPSWVSYAMEFLDTGYFIHDAPWRSVFGPGSNGPGTPGTNYGGSHGCVNAPLATAKFLYGWAPIGTPVDVLN